MAYIPSTNNSAIRESQVDSTEVYCIKIFKKIIVSYASLIFTMQRMHMHMCSIVLLGFASIIK